MTLLARVLSADVPSDLHLALRRLGLPGPHVAEALEKLPHLQVLLTGLAPEQAAFLARMASGDARPGPDGFPSFLPGDEAVRPGSGLLSGRREQFLLLTQAARAEGGTGRLVEALERALASLRPPPPLQLAGRRFVWGERTHLMGVVNVTPDSFSDGGRFLSPEAAVAHGQALVAAGADLLDIGGESTRPGSLPVEAAEEAARVVPVIEALRARVDVPLSVDTTKAEVARAALAAGASLVNDVSGFTFDPELPRVVAEAGAACCLQHMLGRPETMQQAPHYADVVAEVLARLEEGVARAVGAGVARERILVDPGIGFGKTVGHNLLLLRRLADLRQLGLPVLVGTSRKAFLGTLTGRAPAERVAATVGSVAAVAALGGADVVRVHDVAECRDALAVADALRHAEEAGELFQARADRLS